MRWKSGQVDFADSAGTASTDENGKVLDAPGQADRRIVRKPATDAAPSIFRGTYPGPGTMLGPAIAFGWHVAMHVAATQR